MGAESRPSRKGFLKKVIVGALGLSGLGSYGYWAISEDERERAEKRLKVQQELANYRYEVRIPSVPGGLTGEDGMFFTRDRPTTEMDSQGVVHMLLTGDVLRYDPRIVKNPLFPYEPLPGFDIVNPVNVGVIDRFPQK